MRNVNDSSSSLSVVNCPVKSNEVKAASSINTPKAGAGEESVSFPSEQQLDFIGTSNAVKDLFSLPYSSKDVSVAVHNINGTLLIDAGEPEAASAGGNEQGQSAPTATPRKRRSRNQKQSSTSLPDLEQKHLDDQSSPSIATANTTSLISLSSASSVSQQSEALALLTSMIQNRGNSAIEDDKDKQSLGTSQSGENPAQLEGQKQHEQSLLARLYDPSHNLSFRWPASDNGASSSPRHSMHNLPDPREYLQWKVQDMNILVGSDALIYRAQPTDSNAGQLKAGLSSLAVRIVEASEMRDQLQQHERMVNAGQFIPDHALNKCQQIGKPSYAEALQAKSTQQLADQEEELSTSELSRDSKVSSISVPDLDQVQLQTCIVPFSNSPLGGLLPLGNNSSDKQSPVDLGASATPSPTCTVLDAYLDNIMANVPQLALCLREKGFVQSVKLLRTDRIPSDLMKSSTLDTSCPFEVIDSQSTSNDRNIFSPQIMEMNALTLLRFLKANCSVDNATYLFRREAGQTNIQLYDVSSISTQRQRKWIWWLAMMSYRFANRLRHLSMNLNNIPDHTAPQYGTAALKRSFRTRQRSLLQNTLNLLQELADMDGGSHETLVAEVCEKLADTFLGVDGSDADSNTNETNSDLTPTSATGKKNNPTPVASASTSSSQEPYCSVTVDSLNKAQDHLVYGIDMLWKEWERTTLEAKDLGRKSNRRKRRSSAAARSREQKVVSIVSGDSSNSSSSSEENSDNENSQERNSVLTLKIDALMSQLYGLHHKLINVTLQLAERHLKNYFSSSAMQSLRAAARRMADSINLIWPSKFFAAGDEDEHLVQRIVNLQLQYIRLWEHCGHFARSFAADELWRERGHCNGNDVVSVLCDVEAAFRAIDVSEKRKNGNNHTSFLLQYLSAVVDPLSEKTKGMVSLQSLSAIVSPLSHNGPLSHGKKGTHALPTSTLEEGLKTAKALMDGLRQLQRDKWHVLVASCISYSRAIDAYQHIKDSSDVMDEDEAVSKANASVQTCEGDGPDSSLLNLLRQRLGDACNETGKVLLTELRIILTSGTTANPGSGKDDTKATSDDRRPAAESLLHSAEFWFLEGLGAFEACGDMRNIALLRCNLCQCYKLRANSNFSNPETIKAQKATTAGEGTSHAELCLQEAAAHLQSAHEVLGERDVDPVTWDMVSEELAATFLVLGVRRRQSLLGGGNTPVILQALRLSPGKERSIIDPMERALKIYEQSGNKHQAAAAHYQLALFFSKVWTCQRDENKTREKLSAAFQHYNAAHSYFANFLRGNEPTFVLLCLDLSSLYAAVSGEECLTKALVRCLDTTAAFSREAINVTCESQNLEQKKEWLNKMETLASSVEDRIFKLLRSLVKEETNEGGPSGTSKDTPTSGKYKELYRSALTSKMGAHDKVSADEPELSQDKSVCHMLMLHEVTQVIKDELGKKCRY